MCIIFLKKLIIKMPLNSGTFIISCYNNSINTNVAKEGGTIYNLDPKVKSFLKAVKRNICHGNYTFAERDKSFNFLKYNGLTIEDATEIIYNLTPVNWIGGPQSDRDGYPGDVCKFISYDIDDLKIYIKIRYNPPNEVVIISFHEEEF